MQLYSITNYGEKRCSYIESEWLIHTISIRRGLSAIQVCNQCTVYKFVLRFAGVLLDWKCMHEMEQKIEWNSECMQL